MVILNNPSVDELSMACSKRVSHEIYSEGVLAVSLGRAREDMQCSFSEHYIIVILISMS